MSSVFLADCILILHALFIAVVVFSVPLIVIGGLRKWRWVRTPWFRFSHLGMIGFVATEALIGMVCPLTLWESQLRLHAGAEGYENNDFIATWLTRLIFYPLPPWVFTVAYVCFALLVAGLFHFVPVQRKPRQ